MTTESVEYILSAKDNASSVIRKSTADMSLLNHEIQQNAKGSAASSGALQKFANVVGAGWIGDAAAQAKELAEGAKGMSESLQGGGKAALVMKAGLVGLVAYGSFSVGKMISDWVWNTKAAREEMESLKAVFKEQSETVITAEQRTADLRKRNFDLLEGSAAKEKAAKEQEIALADEVYKREMSLAQLRGKGDGTYTEIMKKVLDGKKAELAYYKNFNSEEEKAYRQKVETNERVKSQEKERLDYILAAEEKRKKLAEERAKFEEQQIEKEQKLREQAIKKQQESQIKSSADSMKAIEQEIADLGKVKSDSSRPSLNSGDERMTSLARGGGDIQQQIAEHTKRQAAIAVRQEKLQVMMEKHLKLIAEKEEKVIEFAGAG